MRISILAAAALGTLALAACGSETSGEFTTEDGETGEYVINSDSGEASMTIETEDGQATMRSGSDVDPNLPEGWSVYPGAEVSNVVNIDGPEGGGTMVNMAVEAGSAEIIDFYKGQAGDTGYEVEMELTTGDVQMIGGKSADDSSFSVSVTPGDDGEGVNIQLMVGKGG